MHSENLFGTSHKYDEKEMYGPKMLSIFSRHKNLKQKLETFLKSDLTNESTVHLLDFVSKCNVG